MKKTKNTESHKKKIHLKRNLKTKLNSKTPNEKKME